MSTGSQPFRTNAEEPLAWAISNMEHREFHRFIVITPRQVSSYRNKKSLTSINDIIIGVIE